MSECSMCGNALYKTIYNGHPVAKCNNCGSIFHNDDIVKDAKDDKPNEDK